MEGCKGVVLRAGVKRCILRIRLEGPAQPAWKELGPLLFLLLCAGLQIYIQIQAGRAGFFFRLLTIYFCYCRLKNVVDTTGVAIGNLCLTRTSVVCGPSRLRGEERYVRATTCRVWGKVTDARCEDVRAADVRCENLRACSPHVLILQRIVHFPPGP